MKMIELKPLLRTAVLTASLAAIMGMSACSSEKEDTNGQSADGIETNQGSEVTGTASQEGTPSPTNDTNVDAAADSTTNSSDGTGTTNQSGSTDSMGNDEVDDHTDENPNLDQTAAEGLQ
ncbi:hypothetical protein [Psychrobacter sp. DAB_AL43B]|uniref:hypothetical protein n=1 Tax=Psychrobacter sp. DAB_AL43B TaxID=1028416 RepID=UPI0009A9135F|nr:hypothetical protein [Psychrobacter sp. DAB_AL43B]SLJ84700.1 hypothetical protein DABAL43B_1505 [Psychrobacter sp. DAB_AL43B]